MTNDTERDTSSGGNAAGEMEDGATDGDRGPEAATDESSSTGRERARVGWGPLGDIQEAVSDLVDSAIRGVSPAGGRHPRYDIVDMGDDGYRLSFDLPGLEKSDVEVSATDGELTIEGTRSRPSLPDGTEVLRSERPYGRFRRSVRVPADVDVGRISAHMTNGVLEVSLPRKEARDAHRVVVE